MAAHPGAMDYYYRRIVVEDEPFSRSNVKGTEAEFLDRIDRVLSAFPTVGVPPNPTVIIGSVYQGSTANAENLALLKGWGITYVLNCGGGRPFTYRRMRKLYVPETGILGYEELGGEDDDECNVKALFDRAHRFIDDARSRGGRVLVYGQGVNLAGAVAISYLVACGFRLLEATKLVKDQRRVTLVNRDFMRQLVEYAARKGLLDLEIDTVAAPIYGRPLDRYRIRSSHLPQFL